MPRLLLRRNLQRNDRTVQQELSAPFWFACAVINFTATTTLAAIGQLSVAGTLDTVPVSYRQQVLAFGSFCSCLLPWSQLFLIISAGNHKLVAGAAAAVAGSALMYTAKVVRQLISRLFCGSWL